ncbi:MAG: PQQ-binding-like beta-propeller repeat protein, partial [Candidatus Micrarchaeota archaeon]|nr:PQQ-binding-like beta-propeller repeat protein [Candidatus Micrarchaeota archaeon]
DRFVALNFANGRELWSQQTGGWVQSSPAITDDGVYFGSNDGYLYAVDSAGNLRWKFNSGAPIWSNPAVLGKQVVFGNNAGQLFGVDTANGQKIWSFSGDGRAYTPIVYKDRNTFIFGTSKGMIYSVSSSPICSFTSPSDGDAIGDWPSDIEGNAYSESGIDRVEVRVENGNWMMAAGAEEWYASVDFTGKAPGGYMLECRATDKSGRSETNQYSSISVIKQDSLALQKQYISAPSEVKDKDNFTLYVTDSNGKDLHGVTITIGDVKKTDKSPFAIQLGKTGPVEIGVSKPGFESGKIIVVGVGEGNLLVPMIIVVATAAAGYYFFIRKPKSQSKYSSL